MTKFKAIDFAGFIKAGNIIGQHHRIFLSNSVSPPKESPVISPKGRMQKDDHPVLGLGVHFFKEQWL